MSAQFRKLVFVVAAVAILAVIVLWWFRRPAQHSPGPTASSAKPHAAMPVWGHITKAGGCVVNGALPDSGCTPGDLVLENTKEVLCGQSFRTSSIRDSVTSPMEKRTVYDRYSIPHPSNNKGGSQVCEIDHLVPLELGGADTMANLWPECSAGYAGWQGAGFRDKDHFENYLRRQVCSGNLSLSEAQFEIATDWFRFWAAAGRPGDRD
jgi:hypothetical protein